MAVEQARAVPAGTTAADDVVLRAPPRLPDADARPGVVSTLPMLGGLGSVVLVASLGSAGVLRLAAAGLLALATVGFVLAQVDRQRRQRERRLETARTAYLRHLAEVRARLRALAEDEHAAALARHPGPRALVEGRARWPPAADDGALHVRCGLADAPAHPALVLPAGADADDVDPAAASAVRRLVAVHRVRPALPLVLDLAGTPRLTLAGPPGQARAVARALVCSAAAGARPTSLLVAVLTSDERRAGWEWVRWLPHAGSPLVGDAVGPRRLVGTSPTALSDLLPPGPGGPHLLLVVDLPDPRPATALGRARGVTLLEVGGPPVVGAGFPDETVLRLDTGSGDGDPPAPDTLERPGGVPTVLRADRCGPAEADAAARALAARHGAAPGPGTPDGRRGDPHEAVLRLLGLAGPGEGGDPDAGSAPGRGTAGTAPARSGPDLLRVPVGVADDGTPVHLDLKEAARGGAGPHGLVVGATGSGKSELLRTLVLGLAATHRVEQLSLLLVDFKGGAAFAPLAGLPHVAGMVTNLADDLTLVDRVHDALAGELQRRQELLRAAGVGSAHEHDQARAAGSDLPPLPTLLVVVDELSELLGARPDLLVLLTTVGRLGRSLGVHLLLASQRLDEGRLGVLEPHLSYRVALRTFGAADSRAVLGTSEAAELPARPGLGYLSTRPGQRTRFTATYVSGPAAHPVDHEEPGARGRVLRFGTEEVPAAPCADRPADVARSPRGRTTTLLEQRVASLSHDGARARVVWLPPLAEPPGLGALLGELVEHPGDGLVAPAWRGGGLRLPIGVVDRPRQQRRDPLVVDLDGAGGHLVVVGGPRSGKSTVLRTALAALALVRTPREAQVLVLDLGGGALVDLADLPHVVGVAGRADPAAQRRVVAQARAVLERREATPAAPVPGTATPRERWADGWGELVLVVDGWGATRPGSGGSEELEAGLQQLASRGLAHDVHLLLSAARWSDLRPATRDLLGSRLELRLGDPLESEIDRRAAAAVPPGRPGRGMVAGGLQVLTALPHLGEAPGTGHDPARDLVHRVRAAWPGPPAPRLRALPERVDLASLRSRPLPGAGRRVAPGHRRADRRLVLGLAEPQHDPVALDLDVEPHLLLLGEAGSGRTATLRLIAHEVVRTRDPVGTQVVVVDPRRTLLDEVPTTHLLAHLGDADQARSRVRELASYLHGRLPGPDVGAERLRRRDWWRGAEVVVLVDDHDLGHAGGPGPLEPLLPLLPRAADVGLHLVVARSTGGAARGLHEPVVRTLRELGGPTLLLAGDPDEGPLVAGLRAGPAPPGRARLVGRRAAVRTVQVAWAPPTGE